MNTQGEREQNDRVWRGKVTAKLEQIAIDQAQLLKRLDNRLEKLDEFKDLCRARHSLLDNLVLEQKGHITVLKDQMSRLFKVIIGVAITIITVMVVQIILTK